MMVSDLEATPWFLFCSYFFNWQHTTKNKTNLWEFFQQLQALVMVAAQCNRFGRQ